MADSYEISDAHIVKETDAAVLVEAAEFDQAMWIPKSVIDRGSSEIDSEGESGTLVVYGRFARDRGWV
jgi:hypothetical protein